jgi:hypothetical protein
MGLRSFIIGSTSMSLTLLVGDNGSAAAETRFYIAITTKKRAAGVSKIGNTPEFAAAPPYCARAAKGRTFFLLLLAEACPSGYDCVSDRARMGR